MFASDRDIAMVRSGAADLSRRQSAVLRLIEIDAERADGRTVRALSKALKVSKPAITREADRLGELGFVVRRPDPDDGRSVILDVLPAGRAWLRTLDGGA